MNIKMFYHSLISDWNHGNAHFLRGVVQELQNLGHEVEVFEEENNWSLQNLKKDLSGDHELKFKGYYPSLSSTFYNSEKMNLEELLSGADLVIVHEWNSPELVKAIGDYHKINNNFRLLFHDTHHRAVSAPEEMEKYNLENYDGVLAFGNIIRDIYLNKGWAKKAWTWHEAADIDLFKPLVQEEQGDLVWIGNWGDNERKKELFEFLIEPVRELGLKAKIYGVRYPKEALVKLEEAGIEYGGYLPNYMVPEVFNRYKFTVHVPRRYYRESLPGIPTIRPFEAMACGIPMISAPWEDAEKLFKPGEDYLVASDKNEMIDHMQNIMDNPALRFNLAQSGRRCIIERHSCKHRAEELINICKNDLKIKEVKALAV